MAEDALQLLLPHQGPARLVERVLAWRADGLECVGRIPAESPFVSEGSAPAFVGLELAAQGAAVLEALLRRRSGETAVARVGYLVGVKEARFGVACLPVQAELVAAVRLVGGAPPLAVYSVRVEHAGVECVSGTLSTYAADARQTRRERE